MVFILQMERFESSSKAPVEGCPAAAGGRKRQNWLSAAVEKRKEKRKPAAFSGHRKADQILPPQPYRVDVTDFSYIHLFFCCVIAFSSKT